MNAGLGRMSTPQLRKLHSGKVRESFRLDEQRRLIVATDRISAFDVVLKTLVPGKGAVLSTISNYWFEATRHIVPSHFISAPHPQAIIAAECEPVRVEMIVRSHLAGSAWRAYESGVREISAAALPDGLRKNQKLDRPIVTPTTKEESDREITPEGIVAEGLCSESTYRRMERIALELFAFGSAELARRGVILVDSKYEFGTRGDTLTLMDEIHSPDCSRFWDADSYARDPMNPVEFDKEYVRRWLRENTKDGRMPLELPPEVVEETRKRYFAIAERITGRAPDLGVLKAEELAAALAAVGIIKSGYVVIFMGSKGDLERARRIAERLEGHGVYVDLRVVSAHKNGERIAQMAAEYNESPEAGVAIAVAGRSNGLGGALAANLNIPLISCPPFADLADFQVNVNSSLMMPSGAPAMTVVGEELAAEAALRCLNLPFLRAEADERRRQLKERLACDDEEVRRLSHA